MGKNLVFYIHVLLMLSLQGVSIAQDKYEMTVATDGSGDFKTIQQAIDACKSFPDRRITISVKKRDLPMKRLWCLTVTR